MFDPDPEGTARRQGVGVGAIERHDRHSAAMLRGNVDRLSAEVEEAADRFAFGHAVEDQQVALGHPAAVAAVTERGMRCPQRDEPPRQVEQRRGVAILPVHREAGVRGVQRGRTYIAAA